MKRTIVIASSIAILVTLVVGFWVPDCFVKIYHEKAQFPIFSGFLTLSGFILSIKTNLLLKLGTDLFGSAIYKERVITASILNGEPVRRHAPLINLGRFLIATVLACLIVAIVQITIGFGASKWAIGVALGFAAGGMCMIISAWVAIRGMLERYFEVLTEQDEKDLHKRPVEPPL